MKTFDFQFIVPGLISEMKKKHKKLNEELARHEIELAEILKYRFLRLKKRARYERWRKTKKCKEVGK